MKFLDIDGPLIQFLSKMADIMWLNILTIVCCIPVITAGASLTALHYMVLKIVRDEDGYITRGYFKAFKENFKQSTAIWLIFLVVGSVLAVDYRIFTASEVELNNVVKTLIFIFGMMVVFTFVFVFPVQAKFANPVRRTIWNSFVFSVVQFPRTILMIVLYILPYVIGYFFPRILPVVMVFCISLPALLSAKLYNKFFLRLEDQILARDQTGDNEETSEGGGETEEDERIFKDELDESIQLSQND